MDDADIVLASRTQSAETIQKILNEEGFEGVAVETSTFQQDDPALVADPAPDSSAVVDAGTPAGEVAEPVVADPETADTEVVVEDTDPEKHKRSGAQRRKAKLAAKDAEIAATGSENADLRSRLEELERRLEEQSSGPIETPGDAPVPLEKPNLDDFVAALVEGESYEVAQEKYQDARDAWRDQERDKRDLAKAETARTKRTETAAQATDDTFAGEWIGQLTQAKADHPDWDEAIAKDHGKPVSNPVMVAAVQNLPDGAERIYYLATHPEEAHAIANATALKPGASQKAIDRAFAVAYSALGRINLPDAEADETPVVVAAAPPAARESRGTAPVPVVPVVPVVPKVTPQPKAAPPSTVGSRGGAVVKRFEDYTQDEMRAMPISEYRKLRGM